MGQKHSKKDLTDFTEEELRNGTSDSLRRNLPETEREILCEFMFSGPATTVEISGNFLNNWRRFEPMTKREGVFVYSEKLPPGRYLYKFRVDGRWMWNPDFPSTTDAEGNINNVMDLLERDKTGIDIGRDSENRNEDAAFGAEISDSLNEVEDLLDGLKIEDLPRLPDVLKTHGYFNKEIGRTRWLSMLSEGNREEAQDIERLLVYEPNLVKPLACMATRLAYREAEKWVLFGYTMVFENKTSNMKFYLGKEPLP